MHLAIAEWMISAEKWLCVSLYQIFSKSRLWYVHPQATYRPLKLIQQIFFQEVMLLIEKGYCQKEIITDVSCFLIELYLAIFLLIGWLARYSVSHSFTIQLTRKINTYNLMLISNVSIDLLVLKVSHLIISGMILKG